MGGWQGFGHWLAGRFDNIKDAANWTVDQVGKTGERVGGFFVGGEDGPKGTKIADLNGGPSDMYGLAAGAALQQQAKDFLAGLSPQDPYAAARAAYENQIRNQYQGLRDQATGYRDQANASLAQGLQDYLGSIGNNYNAYQRSQQMTDASISNRGAQMQSRMDDLTKMLMNSLVGQGANGAAIQAQGMANQNTLAAQNQLQADLAARLSQVAAGSQKNWENSGQLVNQGATGRVQDQYNAQMLALQRAEQAALQGDSGSNGSGRGSSGEKMTAAEKRAASIQEMIDNAVYNGDQNAFLALMAKENPNLYSTLMGLDKEDEKQARQFQDLIGGAMAAMTSQNLTDRLGQEATHQSMVTDLVNRIARYGHA